MSKVNGRETWDIKSLETDYTRMIKAQYGRDSREYRNAMEQSREDFEADIQQQLQS